MSAPAITTPDAEVSTTIGMSPTRPSNTTVTAPTPSLLRPTGAEGVAAPVRDEQDLDERARQSERRRRDERQREPATHRSHSVPAGMARSVLGAGFRDQPAASAPARSAVSSSSERLPVTPTAPSNRPSASRMTPRPARRGCERGDRGENSGESAVRAATARLVMPRPSTPHAFFSVDMILVSPPAAGPAPGSTGRPSPGTRRSPASARRPEPTARPAQRRWPPRR